MITPIILSGGEGRRLWPLSSSARPKQFLALTGDETLLQQTVRRLSTSDSYSAPIIIGGASQRFLIAEQLLEAGLSAARIVLEPMGRNTGPALAVGTLIAAEADPDGLILSVHADAAIPDAEAFRASVAKGVTAAEAGALVLFGITPTFASTGYGYMQPGAMLDEHARRVERFLEKPAADEAEALVASGALWNSGIFLMRASALIAAFETHAPEVLAAAREALARAAADPDFLRLDPDAFAAAPSIAIDHAIFERTADAAVVAADFAWNDIGSWSAVWEAQAHDGAGNATRGPVVLEAVDNCLVFTEGPQVAVYGVSDLVIVATADRVLVTPMRHDQQVRRLAELSDQL